VLRAATVAEKNKEKRKRNSHAARGALKKKSVLEIRENEPTDKLGNCLHQSCPRQSMICTVRSGSAVLSPFKSYVPGRTPPRRRALDTRMSFVTEEKGRGQHRGIISIATVGLQQRKRQICWEIGKKKSRTRSTFRVFPQVKKMGRRHWIGRFGKIESTGSPEG